MTARRVEFYVEGWGGFGASTYSVEFDTDACRPALLPRLDPEAYRDLWARACASYAVKLARRKVRQHRGLGDGQRVPPIVAVRDPSKPPGYA